MSIKNRPILRGDLYNFSGPSNSAFPLLSDLTRQKSMPMIGFEKALMLLCPTMV
jgi:hypothetical protein